MLAYLEQLIIQENNSALLSFFTVYFLHRADHHSRWGEHPSSAHRGSAEGQGAHHQQRHADRGQAQVPLHVAHPQSNRASVPAHSPSWKTNKNNVVTATPLSVSSVRFG